MSDSQNAAGIDWVSKRCSECSLPRILKQLEMGANEDVAAIRESKIDFGHQYGTTFGVDAFGSRFAVIRSVRATRAQIVEFWTTPRSIMVKIDSTKTLEAIPAINAKGQCVLLVDGKELEPWQLRQIALSDLLFVPEVDH